MKIGILGYGSIGRRHHANIIAMGHDAALYDPFIEDIAGNRSLILNHSDAVVICSPSTEHERDLRDALAMGLPVLCEKPFGYADADAVRRLLAYPQVIATGFNLRFHSCVKEAKRLMPEIGEPVFASFTVNQKTEKPVYLRDGILRNWCSHEIDLANHLLGPGGRVNSCVASGEKRQDTTEAWISMDHPKAGKVFIQADYYSDPERRFFFIEGSKGGIYVDLIGRNVFQGDKKTNKRWQVYAGQDSFDENYVEEMQCFINSVEKGECMDPLATGYDGVTALYQVLDAREKAGLK